MMADLVHQLQFAPAETLCRHMDNAERLANELDPASLYPWEYVLFRITAVRLDRPQDPVLLRGADVRADAAVFVLHASRAARITPAYANRSPLDLNALAARLKVTPATIQRYRAQGLICHAVQHPGKVRATTKLVCFEDSLARFLASLAHNGRSPSTHRRISGSESKLALDRAQHLRAAGRATLNSAARQIARELGRSHEAVRQLLKRHDREADHPIFTDRGPLTARQKSLILRAAQRGIPTGEIARRLRKSAPAVHHALVHARADRLRAWPLSHVELPTFTLPDARRVILASPWVSLDLVAPLPQLHASALAAFHSTPDLDAQAELAMLAGYNFLKRSALEILAAFTAAPAIAQVDHAETLLRWATLVKAKLLRCLFGSCIRQIEQNLGAPLAREPAAASLLRLAVQIISNSIESTDPSRGQRLSRLCVLSIDREMARRASSLASKSKAARSASPNAITGYSLTPWDRALGLPSALRAALHSLPDPRRRILCLKYGSAADHPRTNLEICSILNLTQVSVTRTLNAAIREARRPHAGP